jgi:glycosyltransferase involved in cell wall biosynthesis
LESNIGLEVKLTVAICCLNSEKVLPNTLKTLRANTPKDLKVIVVDDGSKDDTAKIAAEFGALVISHPENMGYAQARQSALNNCQTEILAYIDDSCLITPDWFSTLEKLWADAPESTKAIVGLMEIHQPQSFLQKFQFRHNPFLPLPISLTRSSSFFSRLLSYLKGKKLTQAGPISSFSNGNASLRVTALEAVGGYDLRYAIGAEDEDLASRIIRKFGKTAIYFDPTLTVFHSSDESFGSFIKRSFKYGRSAALRYRLEGGLPTVMPIPALIISIFALELLASTRMGYESLLLTLISIPLFYAARSQSIRYWIPDSYLLFLSECAHLTGFLTYLSKREEILVPEMSTK